MMNRRKSSDKVLRKVTPPSPSYMNSEQFAAYLSDLRNNRVARPGGARPLPVNSATQPKRQSISHESMSSSAQPGCSSQHTRANSDATQQGPASISSRYSTASSQRHSYYQAHSVAPLKPSEVVPSATYMERGQRWMEKEEVGSLRQAMQDMEVKREGTNSKQDEDSCLYYAALEEASELVWQHQQGRVPQPNAPYRYRDHLRKNSYAHARTASVGKLDHAPDSASLTRDTSRSFSGSSTDSDGPSSRRSRPSLTLSHRDGTDDSRGPERIPQDSAKSKSYKGIALKSAFALDGRRRSSMKRDISGEIERPFSGDQIWEEPDAASAAPATSIPANGTNGLPLVDKPKNPQSRVQFATEVPAERSAPWKVRSKVDIHKNPPTQSRNPQYVMNQLAPLITGPGVEPKKNGVEIRSNEIRDATSLRLKDRSERLPMPTAVSDLPGRPIVSFDAKWKPLDEPADGTPGPARGTSRLGTTDNKNQPMSVPTIMVADMDETTKPANHGPSIPTIAIGDDDDIRNGRQIPVIITPGDDSTKPSPRPLPTPGKALANIRPARHPRGHWSPAPLPGSRVAASCHECGFPIEGRYVSLAGSSERFHPGCFSCFACGTGLEALEISPEPEHHRNERLDRIKRRAQGELLENSPGQSEVEDGDERLRFYCHLDWHELYAPRCKHCKTPIVGEHVVALGEHWHYGHFFCAECGDPFEQGMTHIEKDGYAWCINCQTKRTERRAPKCKKCRCAVIGQYIIALDGEWHEQCFRCASCHGGFDDGQIFPKEEGDTTVVLCTRCRAVELKA